MKKFIFFNLNSILFNLVLFICLLVGIQNNHDKKSINFLVFKTIDLPIGFIVGSSVIIGSLCGNVIYSINKINSNNSN